MTPSNNAVFNFTTPIVAFGAYFTGVNQGSPIPTIVFDDGTSQTFQLIGGRERASRMFSSSASRTLENRLSSVTLAGNTTDVFGIDDVRFVNATDVPEPSTFSLAILSLWTGLGGPPPQKDRCLKHRLVE